MNVEKQVKKRDGRIKPFDEDRVLNSIKKAYIAVYNDTKETDEYFCQQYSEMKDTIEDGLNKIKSDILEINKIQDIIIKNIIDKKVKKAYKKYRDARDEEREKDSPKEQFYKEILECSNLDNDNANVEQNSFSGRKYRIADYEQKMFSLRNLINPKVREAFEDGYIYIHDLSSYAIGEHNCLFANLPKLLNEGFKTRNGDVRPANSFSTACQLVAVIFQVQSQNQFGGVASCGLDFELEPFVHKSFVKLFREGLNEFYPEIGNASFISGSGNIKDDCAGIINIDNKSFLEQEWGKAYDYAIRHLEKEGMQAAQGLFHNLNTLESRAGSQVPFTSINYGRNTSTYGRMINKWLLKASIEGIGKHNRTSIFPISIFQYKKGVNDKEGTPNYDLKKLAIESLSKRIYPNFANGDWTENIEDPNDYSTFMATMGCRTLLGKDRHTNSYSKLGRGNISPITINLPKLGLEHGIKLNDRTEADLDSFMKDLDRVLNIVETGLVERYEYICNQNVKSAQFMYENGTIKDADKCIISVREAMKHGTNAIGLIGIAEMCNALFNKHHGESLESYKFALKIVKHISNFCKEASERNDMNFSCYFTPAENACKTMRNILFNQYGEVEGVTNRPYLTNSIHIPVWFECDAFTKLTLESPFTKYGTGGCITYVELSSNAVKNPEGIEKLIDYAMSINIPYLALNFPIDTCGDCGYSSQINEDICPVCGSDKIERLKRVTGYLTVDYRKFNDGKIAEVNDRVIHESFNSITAPVLEYAINELRENGVNI